MYKHIVAVAAALRSALGLDLTGPYDVLSGRLRGMPSDKCVLHSRHYYDPPEMTTVLTMQRTDEGLGSCVMGFHMGYFRCVSVCNKTSCIAIQFYIIWCMCAYFPFLKCLMDNLKY